LEARSVLKLAKIGFDSSKLPAPSAFIRRCFTSGYTPSDCREIGFVLHDCSQLGTVVYDPFDLAQDMFRVSYLEFPAEGRQIGFVFSEQPPNCAAQPHRLSKKSTKNEKNWHFFAFSLVFSNRFVQL